MLDVEYWTEWVAGILLGVLGWISVRLHSRVDNLEKTKASASEVIAISARVDDSITRLRERMDEKFDIQTREIMDLLRSNTRHRGGDRYHQNNNDDNSDRG